MVTPERTMDAYVIHIPLKDNCSIQKRELTYHIACSSGAYQCKTNGLIICLWYGTWLGYTILGLDRRYGWALTVLLLPLGTWHPLLTV